MDEMMQKNPFPGVNPILNSFFQQPSGGGWEGFHLEFIGMLTQELNLTLPQGYAARAEASLQVAFTDDDAPKNEPKPQVKPDLAVADVLISQRPTNSKSTPTHLTNKETSLLPTLELEWIELGDEGFPSAVVIYTIKPSKFPGIPVLRIELLSPANKYPGSHYMSYLHKRDEVLHTQIRLVEIDLLHERKPIDPRIPSYIDRREGALPYHILVTDPRQTPEHEPRTLVYSFGVLDAIPTPDAPLQAQDKIRLDLNYIYQRIFDINRTYHDVVDSNPLPVNFHRYTDADQAAIRTHIERLVGSKGEV